ncbi:uncharacterized protein LOC102714624 [Oryza brachyantha]|uniref:DUF7036 domain-containing protein n=1 Tax=Oryza brachyantha TaxID=4533 RepID=J3LHG0_ORYBR|nr:uncharacterized protein LOC102714624 [Oryza brachyantha]
MGKTGDAEQAVPSPAPAAGDGSVVRRYAAAIGRAADARCVLVLLLSIGVLLLALFMLLPLPASKIIPDDDPGILPGEVQASFFLFKKRQQLISHVRMLQKDISREIGVPNTMVSVSMHTSKYKDSTYVKFGILSNPRNSSISAQSIIALRKNLIQLILEQSNLSLTPSVFGDPHCLEILGFPGGITVPPPPDGNICRTSLFNVTLNRSIHELRVQLKELESVLRFIMQLTPDEDLIVEMTNKNGSTINLPVTVQILIAPNDPSNCIQTYKLKQLAHIIIKSISKNLGLNPSMFGMIENLRLSPYLQSSIPSSAHSPAPAPSLLPSNPEHPESTTTKPYGSFSCPALERRQNGISHRRLLMISPMMVTRFDSWNVHTGRKIRSPLAKSVFLVAASRPK